MASVPASRSGPRWSRSQRGSDCTRSTRTRAAGGGGGGAVAVAVAVGPGPRGGSRRGGSQAAAPGRSASAWRVLAWVRRDILGRFLARPGRGEAKTREPGLLHEHEPDALLAPELDPDLVRLLAGRERVLDDG